MNAEPLAGRTIAVPEMRELDLFAGMLERRGATVLRCPLIAIRDAPDPAPVLAWIREFTRGTCTELILLTGEGLRRLVACIERHEPALGGAFLAELARVRKITRGPKPARALKELGLKADLPAPTPTTAGVIEALRTLDLRGHRVGLQLYGTDPNRPLVEFLEGAGATALTVAPYVYADGSGEASVHALLERMSAGEVDAIAFTSTPQVERLFAVAPRERIIQALQRTLVAAVGPVVAEALQAHGVQVALVPSESFFLKPLTSALETALAARPAGRNV
jgi:uroporphyrinogen-III synthase